MNMRHGKCQWFLKCKRAGTLARQHPRLGEIRICRVCNALVEHLEKGTDETYAALEKARRGTKTRTS